MKRFHILLVLAGLASLVACTEDIVIDKVDGNPLIGVAASFTDETKRHEAILSYTTDFYSMEGAHMVSGARVYVTDGTDTLFYHEDAEAPGHYLTPLAAGRKNTLYHLHAEVPDAHSEDGVIHIIAESYMNDNVEVVDSLVMKPFNGDNDTVPSVFFGDTIEWVYPYFQSLPDPSVVYMPMVFKNDTLLTDTLSQRMVIPMAGYAGFYVNGPEMQAANKEIPIHYFRKSKLRRGDLIRVDLYSIPAEYMYFYYSILMSNSNNPMMGAPSNVESNVRPKERAVGWFLTASVVSAETVFDDR